MPVNLQETYWGDIMSISETVLDTIAEIVAFPPTGREDEIENGLRDVVVALSFDSGISEEELQAEIEARKSRLLNKAQVSQFIAKHL